MSKSSPIDTRPTTGERSGFTRAAKQWPQAPSRPTGLLGRAGYKGRSIGSFVPKLTQTIFEKYGFSAATLLTDWAVIVGPDIAAYTAPERLKWARGADINPHADDNGCGRPGATLMLRVEPVRALDVSYRSRQLIDRINAYFGYRAVAELRLVQAPIKPPAPPAMPPLAIAAAPPTADVSAIDDEPLRSALANLEASIRAENLRRNPGQT